ncbi:triphosphoribosyl-dephospho-CoA synthase [Companilactobacillus allii]|uniref:triphosphoribosyl-dephospho-CoA synthase n=1 Tax=Companilactobacillus allii TaxID=1847728 RepID=A0A1P8Q3A4_9LACO|nr:triphosphoribosyl-dephospho-CoA synthase [Companilactobacillus allii]APX72340.1 triphosphoribosyl-dephospho-CoA synthase [Companilactobacillus allii]USQ69432.1 triphosphoribosyl-dephospho-CoA synthase [Companilactobacillus allii]
MQIKTSIAQLAVDALKWEVNFTPKPGLVDALSNGSHDDMDLSLFLKSADSLLDGFQKISDVSFNREIDVALREDIGAIGRQTESDMFQATGGINTHKGAIWTMSLLISAASSLQTGDLEQILLSAQKLANLPDKYIPQTAKRTHGMETKKKYALSGAKGEAQAGFPNIRKVLNYEQDVDDLWMRRLMLLYGNVNDTNIVYRSNLKVLETLQSISKEIFESNVPVIENAEFIELEKFVNEYNISPGGCADLFAASYFLINLGEE